ncbi:FBP domain-containing protein [Arthrobacter sp. STN4]|nr:FBP domain-containing protein [Arthrobacter sp. STN4]NVM99834.1 FBP domain-containing protein [Arthrobacter sp. SDTb3-6]
MQPMTENDLRDSLINASRRERTALALPADFDTLDWENLDFLGWRDAKLPAVGYVVGACEGGPVGIMLREVDSKARSRPQCSWCEDVLLPNDVVYFNARRAGKAGRNGNTVGTLACSHFECSANARRLPPLPYPGFDLESGRQRRIVGLRGNFASFVRKVRDDG